MTSVDCLLVMRFSTALVSSQGGGLFGAGGSDPHGAGVSGLAVAGPSGLSVAPSGGIRDCLTARLRARQLDRALASGTPPEASSALAFRARRLISAAHRRALADSFRRIVREARAGPTQPSVRVVPSRRQVRAASEELTRLAETLGRPGPVSARGAAQALMLLADGTGPLYNPTSGASLRACAANAADNLEVR